MVCWHRSNLRMLLNFLDQMEFHHRSGHNISHVQYTMHDSVRCEMEHEFYSMYMLKKKRDCLNNFSRLSALLTLSNVWLEFFVSGHYFAISYCAVIAPHKFLLRDRNKKKTRRNNLFFCLFRGKVCAVISPARLLLRQLFTGIFPLFFSGFPNLVQNWFSFEKMHYLINFYFVA